MISRVIICTGAARHSFDLSPNRADRVGHATDLKRFLFPTNSGYHKANKAGLRALKASAPPA